MKVCPKCQWRSESNEKFCPQCGSVLVKEKSDKSGKKWLGKVCTLLLAVACAVCLIYALKMRSHLEYVSDKYSDTYSEMNSYKQKYEEALKEKEELSTEMVPYVNKARFLDQYIGIVDTNSSDYVYHRYDCSLLGMDAGGWSIMAYNTAQAENLGYEPCPECH